MNETKLKKQMELTKELNALGNMLVELADSNELKLFTVNYLTYLNKVDKWQKLAKCGYINQVINDYAKANNLR